MYSAEWLFKALLWSFQQMMQHACNGLEQEECDYCIIALACLVNWSAEVEDSMVFLRVTIEVFPSLRWGRIVGSEACFVHVRSAAAADHHHLKSCLENMIWAFYALKECCRLKVYSQLQCRLHSLMFWPVRNTLKMCLSPVRGCLQLTVMA